MAKSALRAEAIKLRFKGYTYGQIKRELGIAKSTLSDWLRNLPLSEKQERLLTKNRISAKDIRIEKFRLTYRNKRIEKMKRVFSEQKGELLPLSNKELFIAGVFLYWGEGSKQRNIISISNTNPLVIQFAKYWMVNILKVSVSKLQIRLHLYSDMDIDEHIGFWSQTLNISKKQFKPPYIKKTTREGLTYKSFGHGTCNLMCFSSELSNKVAMSIKLVAEQCGANSDLFWYN